MQLRLRDWPGRAGPLIHVPDPLAPDDSLIDELAAVLAPRYRVMSITPRGESAYQVDVADLRGALEQFGFAEPVVLAERLGCVAARVLAAWHARLLAGLVLVDAAYAPPPVEGIFARALSDCRPDWPALERAVECPVLRLTSSGSMLDELETFLAQLEPGET